MNREDIIKNFVKAQGWNVNDLSFLTGDASHRKYYRLQSAGGPSLVIMDAPPTHEDAGIFKRTTEVLQGLGLSSPRILKEDLAQGILVLEDFGNQTYTHCLKNNSVDEETLYRLAVDVLITLYKKVDSHAQVPLFSAENLLKQVNLLMEWYVPAVFKDQQISEEMQSTWTKIWMDLLKPLESERKTIVLWDYHVDNLMWLPDRQGIQRCGLLDFQDAVIGPYPYDLVSLLEDARRDVPRDLQEKMIAYFMEHLSADDQSTFLARYNLLGAQRSTRILGTFVRLAKRDGKKHYLNFMPRVWKWLEQDLQHDSLEDLRYWYETYLPPRLRETPHVD